MGSIADIHAVSIGTTDVTNVRSQGIDSNFIRATLGGSGQPERYGTAIIGKAPIARFATRAIKLTLDKTTTVGLKIDGTDTLTLWLKMYADGAMRKGATSHTKMVIDNGLIYPVTLRASNTDMAELDVACSVCERTGDGSHPVSNTASQSLDPAAGSEEADLHYILGDVTYNAVDDEGVQSVSIDFGVNVAPIGGNGLIYPKGLYVASVQPLIRIVTQDVDMVASIGEAGLDLTSGAVIKLRSVPQNAASSYTAGLTFTVTDGVAYRDDYNGAHLQPGAVGVTIVPTKSGANQLIAVGTYAPA